MTASSQHIPGECMGIGSAEYLKKQLLRTLMFTLQMNKVIMFMPWKCAVKHSSTLASMPYPIRHSSANTPYFTHGMRGGYVGEIIVTPLLFY